MRRVEIAILIALVYFLLLELAYCADLRHHQQEQKRHQAHEQWAAEQLGWTYLPGSNRELYRHHRFLAPLRQRTHRANTIVVATDVFEGRWDTYEAKAFTVDYQTTVNTGLYGIGITHDYLGVVLIHVPREFPYLSIRPAGLLHTIGLHRNPLRFESRVFNRKFVVQYTDKQFAQHFCHTAMMQYFLHSPRIRFEVNQDVLVIYQRGKLKLNQIEPCLERLHRIYKIGLLDRIES